MWQKFFEIMKFLVEIPSLEFVWEQCMKNSVLDGAKVHIAQPEGYARCAECNH